MRNTAPSGMRSKRHLLVRHPCRVSPSAAVPTGAGRKNQRNPEQPETASPSHLFLPLYRKGAKTVQVPHNKRTAPKARADRRPTPLLVNAAFPVPVAPKTKADNRPAQQNIPALCEHSPSTAPTNPACMSTGSNGTTSILSSML